MLYRELPISQNPDDDILGALVGRAKQGSAVAFAELVARVRSRIRWWADRVIHDDDEADDIAQQVLLKLHVSIREFEGRSRFTTWLYRMTVNTALNHRRIKRRREQLLRDASNAAALEAPAREAREETGRVAELLSACASELSGRERDVFEMADLKGMSANEIATALGVQPVSVRAALSRARRRIRLRILELHPHLLEEYDR
jgi:RNA polymerase sigma-70 factor (ECF subfamily)